MQLSNVKIERFFSELMNFEIDIQDHQPVYFLYKLFDSSNYFHSYMAGYLDDAKNEIDNNLLFLTDEKSRDHYLKRIWSHCTENYHLLDIVYSYFSNESNFLEKVNKAYDWSTLLLYGNKKMRTNVQRFEYKESSGEVNAKHILEVQICVLTSLKKYILRLGRNMDIDFKIQVEKLFEYTSAFTDIGVINTISERFLRLQEKPKDALKAGPITNQKISQYVAAIAYYYSGIDINIRNSKKELAAEVGFEKATSGDNFLNEYERFHNLVTTPITPTKKLLTEAIKKIEHAIEYLNNNNNKFLINVDLDQTIRKANDDKIRLEEIKTKLR